MNDVLKQRLVGALILVALGVVFWPIIFVQPETASSSQVQMPPRPEVDTSPVAPPDRAGLRTSPRLDAAFDDNVPEDVNEPQAEPGSQPIAVPALPVAGESGTATPRLDASKTAEKPVATRSEAPAPQKLDAQGVPIAWILQVASVSSEDNANKLRDRLLAMGHKAYVKQVRINDRQLQRVYIGPKFERSRLESLQREIDAEFGVKSMIKRYLP